MAQSSSPPAEGSLIADLLGMSSRGTGEVSERGIVSILVTAACDGYRAGCMLEPLDGILAKCSLVLPRALGKGQSCISLTANETSMSQHSFTADRGSKDPARYVAPCSQPSSQTDSTTLLNGSVQCMQAIQRGNTERYVPHPPRDEPRSCVILMSKPHANFISWLRTKGPVSHL